MEPFTAAPHDAVLLLLTQVAVLLLFARGLGEVARRLGQPSVVGEILAGILLGPSLLSGFVPAIGAWLVPAPGVPGYLLEVVSLLGALFLLLITGLETDIVLIRRHARTAIGVSLGGVLVTFSSGFLLGQSLPDFLLADPTQRLVFALFVATAMSISAIPVIAKVLMDLNLMRRDIGQTIIAAGMSDDTIGWIMLSIVAGLAGTGAVTAGSVVQAVGSVAAFMIFSFTAGRWLVKRVTIFVQDEMQSADRLVTLVIVLTLAWGAMSQALGLEAVLGAFVMGILFAQVPRLPKEVHHRITTVALGIFTPIFFGTAGLKVNARALLELDLLLLTLLVIAVATAGKVAGTYLGARLIGRRDHWTALSFGAGLNARGAMEIIIATIGLELGILSQDMFSIIVIMAMATSLMAPPALRWVLARVRPEEQELARLQKEEIAAGSVAGRIHRVLIPVRTRAATDPTHEIESLVIRELARQQPLSVTLLNVAEPGARQKGIAFLERLADRFAAADLSQKVVESRDPRGEILREAAKDYDLLILGATERAEDEKAIFHPLVDELVRLAPCATLVAKGARQNSGQLPRRILVPTNGSIAARRAAELAFALFPSGSGEVVILHVIQRQERPYQFSERTAGSERELRDARVFVRDLAKLGETQGVHVQEEVREGAEPEDVIVEIASTEGIDLILLGTAVRPGSDRLFLGPRVERLLERAPCRVLILNV